MQFSPGNMKSTPKLVSILSAVYQKQQLLSHEHLLMQEKERAKKILLVILRLIKTLSVEWRLDP